MELLPGFFHFAGCLTLSEQRRLVERVRALAAAPAGAYIPTVRGGGRMSLQMVCLGRHWNPVTYRYEAVRSDHDGRPVQPLPDDLAALASRIAASAGMALSPDICIVSLYPIGGRLGLHQDRDESPESLRAGVPIVSISLGDTARFLVGGTRRRDPVQAIDLASGDSLVMGRESRLRYHGVARIHAGTGPPELGLPGRISLTFRQY